MAIKISTAFVVLILPVALAQNGYIGYNYHTPVSQMQINLRPNNLEQPYYNNFPELQSGFLPSPAYNQQYTSNSNSNQQFETQHAFHYKNQGYQSAQSTYQNANYNRFTQGVGSGSLTAQQNVQVSSVHNPSYMNAQPQQPVITKHIYFHLPPDDTDNVAPVTQAPRKKTYNIIFIKLPSQKSESAARLQQIINQKAAETKTLIYVLVKKPQTQTIQPVTSKPEVFFVKYKDPGNVAQQQQQQQQLQQQQQQQQQLQQQPQQQLQQQQQEQLQAASVDSGLLQVQRTIIPGLLPGQVNGYRIE